jgi:hypothetical protein
VVPHSRANVLFSGHSLLDNPMPDWVELIADSRGGKLGWEEQIVLGSPIRVRTRGDDAKSSGWFGYSMGKNRSGSGLDLLAELAQPRRLAAGEKYDTLLIAERADSLLAIQWENTVGYLRSFHERLAAQNPNVRTLLYQVWPQIDANQPEQWLRFVRQELFAWECVAATVNAGLEASGRKAAVSIVPGGLALAALLEAPGGAGVPGAPRSSQRVAAIFSDNAHLNPLGIYLVAALHYAAIFGKTPVGAAAPPELADAAAPHLQRIAWEVFTRYRERGTPWAHPLEQCREQVARSFCPAYFEYHKRPGNVAGCRDWAGADSPFSAGRALPLPP